MDYEKRYNELLNAVKKLQEVNPSDEGLQNWINENVPELAENEDEKMRKKIIAALHRDEYMTEEEIDECVAWLEKQGEKKPQRMISAEAKEALYDKPTWSEYDEERFQYCLDILRAKGLMGATETINTKWLKSLKERLKGE